MTMTVNSFRRDFMKLMSVAGAVAVTELEVVVFRNQKGEKKTNECNIVIPNWIHLGLYIYGLLT